MKLAALVLALCVGASVAAVPAEKGSEVHPLAFVDASETGDEAENKEESVKNVLARVQSLYLKMKETAGPLGEYKDFMKEMKEALGVMNNVRSGLSKNALTQNNPLAGFFLDSVNATYEQASDMMSVLQSYENTAQGLVDILRAGGSAAGAAGSGLVINTGGAGGASSSGRLEVGTVTVDQRRVQNSVEWTDVRFMQSFDAVPVVTVLPNTGGGSWPVAARVKEVTRTGFRIALVVPPGERHYARRATLPYLAVTPGVHAMPDGTVVEAGVHATRAQQFDPVCGKDLGEAAWADVVFKAPFQSTPAMLTMIQTMENEASHVPTLPSLPFLTVATSDLRATGAKLALERTRATGGTVERPEKIGYVAFQQGGGVFIQHDRKTVVSFEAFVSPPVVEGWQDGMELIQLRNHVPHRGHVAFASLATRNDPEGGWLRLYNSATSYIRLRKDKDLECVSRRHSEKPEQASIVVFSAHGEVDLRPLTPVDLTRAAHNEMAASAVQTRPVFAPDWVKDNNVAADKLRAPGVNMEISAHRVTYRRNHGLTRLDFRSNYRVPPMVFALPDSRGSNPAFIRVKDVTTSNCMASLVEPPGNNGYHATQNVPVLAVEPGVHTLPDGTVLEVGYIDTVKSQADPHCVPTGDNHGWEHIKFKTEFVDPPTVLTFVQTMANEVNSVPDHPSMPWISSVHKDVTRAGFRLALERTRVKLGSISKPERVAYLAVEHRNGKFADARNRAVSFAAESFGPLTQGWSNGCQNLYFRTRIGRTPLLVASKASRNNDAGGWPRLCRSSHHYFSLRMDTDNFCERQRVLHRGESAHVVAFSHDFYLKNDQLPPQDGRALLMGAGEDAQDANNEKDAAHEEAETEETAAAGTR